MSHPDDTFEPRTRHHAPRRLPLDCRLLHRQRRPPDDRFPACTPRRRRSSSSSPATACRYALLLVIGGRLGDLFGRRRLFMLGMAVVHRLLAPLRGGADRAAARRVPGGAGRLGGAHGAAGARDDPVGLQRPPARAGNRRSTARRPASRRSWASSPAARSSRPNIAGTGWRPIFLVNVPLGLLGLVLAWRHVPGDALDRAGARSTCPAPPARRRRCRAARAADRGPRARLAGLELARCSPCSLPPSRGVRASSSGGSSWRAGIRSCRRRSCACPGMRLGLVLAVPFFGGFGAFMFVSALTLPGRRCTSGRCGSGLALVPMAVAFLGASLVTARARAALRPRRARRGRARSRPPASPASRLTLFAVWPHVDALEPRAGDDRRRPRPGARHAAALRARARGRSRRTERASAAASS